MEKEEDAPLEDQRMDVIQKDISNLKTDTLARCHFDSLITARLSEAQDTKLNKAREDKIIINGLTNVIPIPALAEEKKVDAWNGCFDR